MKKNILLTAAALVTTLAGVAQWQPAGDRIRTQWGEKLDPQNVLPEYPRPQMVRGDWQNLNGLWDYTVEDGDWMGIYLKDGKFYESPVHKVHSFEAVGAGDAFGAGLIHAMAHDFAPQRTIDFAISASVLKLMIQHDANVVSEKEIEQIMKQGGTNLQR